MSSKLTRILITGAAGFVGKRLVQLVSARKDLEVFATYHSKLPSNTADDSINWIKADLLDIESCRRVTHGMDLVCNLAGIVTPAAVLSKDPFAGIPENITLNINLIDAAWHARVKSFVYLSSSTGYPSKAGMITENDFHLGEPPPPYTTLGLMFRAIEKLAETYCINPQYQMSITAIRPTGIYGIGDNYDLGTCHALPAFVRKVVERHRPIEIWGDGSDQRDWIFVDDVCQAMLASLFQLSGFHGLNVGSGESVTMKDLLKMIIDIDNFSDVEVLPLPSSKGPPLQRSFDLSRFKSLLKPIPPISLREGLARTIASFRESERGTPHQI